ncbi:MAG: endopeptidase La [Clostridiales bacterium]|nr:endopeptidase La [Clostridiales bacterium]
MNDNQDIEVSIAPSSQEEAFPVEGGAPSYESSPEGKVLPLAYMRGVVVFPGTMVSFDLNKGKSVFALEDALEADNRIFLTAQANTEAEEPSESDLYTVGTITQILQVLRIPGNTVRVIAHGIERGQIQSFIQESPYFKVQAIAVEEKESSPPFSGERDLAADIPHVEVLLRIARENFLSYAEIYGKLMPDIAFEAAECRSAGRMADIIGANIPMPFEKQQILLEEIDASSRLEKAIGILSYELDVLRMQRSLYEKIRVGVEKSQREYILREQLKAIYEELGDDNGTSEIEAYKEKIASSSLPQYAADKLSQELRRLEKSHSASTDAATLRDYLDRALELPWGVKTKENTDLLHAKEILEKDHYGLDKVKERILEFLAARQLASSLNAPIICLLGPPGVGKTSIAKSVASALGRKYARMSLGGVRDEADIRGHRKTYVAAMPGRFIEAMRQAGSSNPLILLDEIDKLSSDGRGSPASALLEALDSEQNSGFRDHYLEMPFDLSDVLFICTANTMETVPQPLIDRLEVIQLSSYTQDEKLHIAVNFLFPKQLMKHGLKKSQIRIKENVINDMILFYTREAGVRQLEREIGTVCRKAAMIFLTEKRRSLTLSTENLESFLGKKKYRKSARPIFSEIGVCQGLAWTPVGGDTLSIEVNTMKGTGKFKLTGNIGNIMAESAQAAISYVRSRQEQLSISKTFYRDTDIHMHIPEGATPKDGPSAGITMACALVSALTGRPILNSVAMTGEITIRGRVLPVGGLKEKILAAKAAGISKVLIPFDNSPDLSELSAEITEGLEFVLIKSMDEVLSHALVKGGAAK